MVQAGYHHAKALANQLHTKLQEQDVEVILLL